MPIPFLLASGANAAGIHQDAHNQNISGQGATHSGRHNVGKHTPQFGRPGTPAEADRTIDVMMVDTAYNFSEISVTRGETIRFRIRNAGELLHEFNIGSAAMHTDHQREMQRMVDIGLMDATSLTPQPAPRDDGTVNLKEEAMHHTDPNALLLEPGQSGELTWTFDTLPADKATLQFACNLPGHYTAGMSGEFHIVSSDAPVAAPTPSLTNAEPESERETEE